MKQRGKMSVRVEGVEDVLRALEKANEDMKKTLRDLISEAAEIVYREVDTRVPIKTGEARASIRMEVGEDSKGYFFANIVIGSYAGGASGSFYITFYELGNSRQPPQPFMRPSLDKSKAKVKQHLIDGLKRVIAQQGK